METSMTSFFNTNDPAILTHLLNVADGRDFFTKEEQQAIAARILDNVQDEGERERLIEERNADGRHPIG